MSGTVAGFAETARKVAATRSKLQKVRLVSEFLRSLSDEDLPHAVTFFTGAPFPRSSGKRLQVGYAALQAAVAALTGATREQFGAEYLKWSDVGDVVAALMEGREAGAPVSLAELGERLERVASAPPGAPTVEALREALSDLGPEEARFVTRMLMAELRIGLQEGLMEESVAAAFEAPAADVRRAHQLTGDPGRTALAARRGTLDTLQAAPFTPLKPMLATAESGAEAIAARLGAELWVEDKFDGIRAQAHCAEGDVRLYSRDLKQVTEQFPEVVEALGKLPQPLILDGEVLAYSEDRALPFTALQKRLGRKAPGEKVLRDVPVVYMAFDLLYHGGEALLDHPLAERRALLQGLPQPPGFLVSPLRVVAADRLEEEFLAAKSRANEGLMVKDPASFYRPGSRGLAWLKYKKPLEPLDVVVTGVEFGHGRRRNVLSDYTFAVRDEATGELVNIGKAYTGLSDAEIVEMTAYFQKNTLRDFGRFRLVKPEVVIEVAFEAIMESARHKSGFALRFPRIVRLRPDRTPADINSLADVRRMFAQYRSQYAAREEEPAS